MPCNGDATAAAKKSAEYELATEVAARAAAAAASCKQAPDDLEAGEKEAACTLAAARRAMCDQSAGEDEVGMAIQRAGVAAMSTHDRATVNAVVALGQKGWAYVVACENNRWATAERTGAAAERTGAAAERKAVSAEQMQSAGLIHSN